jgi:hypothetical protein
MNLDETVRQKVSEWQPPTERQALGISAANWTIHLTADRKDELGCLIWELALCRKTAQGGLELRTWADRIAEHVTGLLEPLKVIEIDALRNEGLLRSEDPQNRSDKLFYYELLLKGTTSACMRRYQGARDGSKREQVAFALTHEALAKLVGDLTADC